MFLKVSVQVCNNLWPWGPHTVRNGQGYTGHLGIHLGWSTCVFIGWQCPTNTVSRHNEMCGFCPPVVPGNNWGFLWGFQIRKNFSDLKVRMHDWAHSRRTHLFMLCFQKWQSEDRPTHIEAASASINHLLGTPFGWIFRFFQDEYLRRLKEGVYYLSVWMTCYTKGIKRYIYFDAKCFFEMKFLDIAYFTWTFWRPLLCLVDPKKDWTYTFVSLGPFLCSALEAVWENWCPFLSFICLTTVE